jgi:2,4-dienoyl-CoA reductase-like NADH-dependent reductase (Old Yellow Enzyme family)
MIEIEKNAIARLGLRVVGRGLFREYPYEELYFLEAAKRVRDAVRCSVVYIGGCSSLASLERVLSEGFDFVQLGRPLIKDPHFVRRAMAEPDYVNGCSHCNRCVALIEHPDGIRCPENDPEERADGPA